MARRERYRVDAADGGGTGRGGSARPVARLSDELRAEVFEKTSHALFRPLKARLWANCAPDQPAVKCLDQHKRGLWSVRPLATIGGAIRYIDV